jgi:hypothetical protein
VGATTKASYKAKLSKAAVSTPNSGKTRFILR